MTNNNNMIRHRYDNTFVIEKNALPYQVIEGMPEYTDLANEYAQHPETFTEELQPAPYVPTQEEVTQAEINRLEATITARNLRAALTGDTFALAKIQEVENQIAELRSSLT